MPGTAVDIYANATKMLQPEIDALTAKFGLDKSLLTQFGLYMKNALQGDFGTSFYYHPRSVTSVIFSRLPWSLFLIFCAMTVQVIIAYFVGVAAAWKAGSKRDSSIQAVALALWATPMFWLAMLALYVFGYVLGWFPFGGSYTAAPYYSLWSFSHIIDIIYHAVLPVSVLVINQFGGYQLIMRNTMVTTLKENYIITAEAKGMTENRVKYKHAARNAMLPMVTSVGLRFSLAVAGSIFTETIFSYPGVGLLIFQSVSQRDFPVLQGSFFILSASVIVMSFLIDLLYLRLDPRIKY